MNKQMEDQGAQDSMRRFYSHATQNATDQQTNRPTNGPTDPPIYKYKGARTRVDMIKIA